MSDFTPRSRVVRRWRQFSLRTLLIVVLVACLPLGWFNFKIERKRRQRRAAEAITSAGGAVWYLGPAAVKAAPSYRVLLYDSQRPDANALERLIEEATVGDVVAVAFRGGAIGDLLFAKRGWLPLFKGSGALSFDGQDVAGSSAGRWVLHGHVRDYDLVHYHGVSPDAPLKRLDWRSLAAFPSLEILSTGDREIGPDELRQIGMLKQLRCLFIHNGKQIDDERLAELSGLTELRVLVIDKSQLSDAGLMHLSGLTNLEVLEIDHAPIRGNGLRHLAPLMNLKVISLRDTPLEDGGLPHLAKLTGLQRLYLFNTGVTDAGLHHLTGLRDLEILHLGKTSVTFDGANSFEHSLGRDPIIR